MLDLWLYGTHLATITVERSDRMRFAYSTDAIDRWGLGSRVFSVAFPIASRPLSPGPTSVIVEGILPEGDALNVLRAGFGSDSDLLLALGRDTIGAIVVVPSGQEPPIDLSHAPVVLTEGEVAARLRRLDTAPLGVSPEGSVRLSIAGQQPKLPLIRVGDGFGDPTVAYPSEVILKPEPGLWPRLAELEEWGLRFLGRAGVPVAPGTLTHFDGIPTLVIERYDRLPGADPDHVRLHQEDLCMAVGAAPDDKYARSDKSKTSLRQLARAVHDNTDDPQRDIEHFVTILLANIAMGNCDAHARNLSLIHDANGAVRLAPAYDVIPTYHYKGLDRFLAQPINGQVMKPRTVSGGHLQAEFEKWGLPDMTSVYRNAFERLSNAIRAVGPPHGSPEVAALLADSERLRPD